MKIFEDLHWFPSPSCAIALRIPNDPYQKGFRITAWRRSILPAEFCFASVFYHWNKGLTDWSRAGRKLLLWAPNSIHLQFSTFSSFPICICHFHMSTLPFHWLLFMKIALLVIFLTQTLLFDRDNLIFSWVCCDFENLIDRLTWSRWRDLRWSGQAEKGAAENSQNIHDQYMKWVIGKFAIHEDAGSASLHPLVLIATFFLRLNLPIYNLGGSELGYSYNLDFQYLSCVGILIPHNSLLLSRSVLPAFLSRCAC